MGGKEKMKRTWKKLSAILIAAMLYRKRWKIFDASSRKKEKRYQQR